MTDLIILPAATLPSIVIAAGEGARFRFLEFFTTNIRNPNTRRAYARAAVDFMEWCAALGVAHA